MILQDVCCDGVKCTPLIAAARHGREGAVRILLEKFRPPVRLETEGTVKFDEYVIEGKQDDYYNSWNTVGVTTVKISDYGAS